MSQMRTALEAGTFAQFREHFVANYAKYEPQASGGEAELDE
jgi:queuine/archaeosine tRNA-ribosyltransferase